MTPAYDICPQLRTGGEARQAMLIIGSINSSQLQHCLAAAPNFLLAADKARAIIRHQVATIRTHWRAVCGEAELTAQERDILWNGAFLNRYAFEGLDAELADA